MAGKRWALRKPKELLRDAKHCIIAGMTVMWESKSFCIGVGLGSFVLRCGYEVDIYLQRTKMSFHLPFQKTKY